MIGEPLILTGISEGLKHMAEGGKATILLPSSLAFGIFGANYYIDGSAYSFGGYTPLLFDLDLLEVKKAVE